MIGVSPDPRTQPTRRVESPQLMRMSLGSRTTFWERCAWNGSPEL